MKHIVLLGMGGSSLAPDVLRNTFGKIEKHPELLILDSTDPAQIRQIEENIDYVHTKFLVASKSGSTLEPNIFKEYFYTRAAEVLGSDKAAGNNFFAVTDPGSNLEKLAQAGHPVVRIDVSSIDHIGQEFFRWEIATAVAGSILGINAFNQPDVEASKVISRDLTDEYENTGSLPAETPMFEADGIALYTDERNAGELRSLAGENAGLADYLKAHLSQLGAGDYFAILGYVNRLNPAHDDSMQAIRHRVRDKFKVATCLGFGPRFRHSTGQAYKGGPNSGVFLQITCDDADDLQVPNHRYSFGVVKAAQARGDFSVLAERKRRALRVHLGEDTEAGFKQLEVLIASALET